MSLYPRENYRLWLEGISCSIALKGGIWLVIGLSILSLTIWRHGSPSGLRQGVNRWQCIRRHLSSSWTAEVSDYLTVFELGNYSIVGIIHFRISHQSTICWYSLQNISNFVNSYYALSILSTYWSQYTTQLLSYDLMMKIFSLFHTLLALSSRFVELC